MTEIFMPKSGMDQTEGTLVRWLKDIGDPVETNEPIMQIETGKTTLEAESPGTGILLAKLVEEGETVPVLQTVGYIGKPGEQIPAADASAKAAETAAGDVPASAETPAVPAEAGKPAPFAGGIVRCTPYARRLAKERGVDLSLLAPSGPAGEVRGRDVLAAAAGEAGEAEAGRATPLAKKYAEALNVSLKNLPGSGFGGKIRKEDVLAAAADAAAPDRPAGAREPVRIRLTPIRKAIAQNMFNSLHSMAQTSDSVEIDVTELVELRKRLVQREELLGTKITINDLLSYAAVKMLKSHPLANARYAEDEIIAYPYVNLSMAVATEYGLTSPVIRDADKMSLVDLSKAMRDIVLRARQRKLTGGDQQGGTFTLTNMGIFPVDSFTPILPSPQSCIIGFGRCEEKPAVYNGEICIRVRMVLSVTYDHRVFDGSEVGGIMSTMKEYLEEPALFLAQ